VPTLIAIGHEVDLSLAELAADARASTPSNAAELLVPDKKDVLLQLDAKADRLHTLLLHQLEFQKTLLKHQEQVLHTSVASHYKSQLELLKSQTRLLEVLSPKAALTRGYALVRSNGHSITSASQVKKSQLITIRFHDDEVRARVE
jgi:exodeoxyribonuclease VII large subunit